MCGPCLGGDGASPALQGWIPAFAGMTVVASSCPRKRVPRGGNGAGSPPRPRDGFLLPVSTRTSFAGMTVVASSCPRKRVPRGGNGAGRRGEWGGVSPASQGWIPAFAGMTVVASSCPRKRVPRWGNGAGSHASQGWIPAFAGMTVGGSPARAPPTPVRGEPVEPCERAQRGDRRLPATLGRASARRPVLSESPRTMWRTTDPPR